MMKSLVIYESAFGNTEAIAFAIRDALLQYGEATAYKTGEFNPAQLSAYDLIVAGSPTQKFNMLPDMRTFLDTIPPGALAGRQVAAFDTRIDIHKVNNRFLTLMVKLFGYAAAPIARKLTKKGGKLRQDPAGFFVEDTKGPLTEGELIRAGKWAAGLAGNG